MIEDIEDFMLDFTKDYRLKLGQFKVNAYGDLLINRRPDIDNGWIILIPRERLTEEDWLSHMSEKAYCNYGEFVRAYFKALEIAGIKQLTMHIYGFNSTCKYADE